ncbi:T9SS type B sorting domain-containing protein [Luteibaculum oceani]|uniref:T9SS type B sorting domain-containing protein n=1 Tax=Luteibaculum oceani TaxID=1294296 RepID=A0A5C6V1A5_9FLAO|nr:gliding motility-associated C-terminal domain-containing protein [Luteibaculum oceani]TXC77078.1 T9SS type B sorting domain-containing protein [Luteibaculum oceani]
MISPYLRIFLSLFGILLFSLVFGQPTSNSPVCEKEQILLKANLTASSYSWTGPNGFSSTQRDPSLTATMAASGDYFLSVVINGNTQTYSTNVQVNQAPEAPQVSNVNGCAGDPINIIPNNNDPGLTYTWTLPGGSTTTGVPLNINTNGGAGGGNYTVVATNPNCTSEVESFSVSVFNKPGLATVNGELNVCEGEPLNITAANTGGNTVVWILPDGSEVTGINLFLPGMQSGNAGTYGVKLKNPGCEGAVNNFTVNVLAPPSGFTISGDTTYCVGDNVRFNLSYGGSLAQATYQWSGPNGFNSNQRNPSFTAQSGNTGTYSVRVTVNPNATGSQKCPSDPVDFTIEVNDYPAAPQLEADPAVQNGRIYACEDDPVTIFTRNKGNSAIKWIHPTKGELLDDTIKFPKIALQDTGIYQVILINGICESSPVNFTVGLTEVPKVLSYEMPEYICDRTELTIIPEVLADYDFTWTLNGNVESTKDTFNLTEVRHEDHRGTLLVDASFFGCAMVTDTLDFPVLRQIKDIGFYTNPADTFCLGDDVVFFTDAGDSATYRWSGPNNFFHLEYGNGGVSTKITDVTSRDAGVYQIITTNPCGADTTSRYIPIFPEPEIRIYGDTGICDLETTEIFVEFLNSDSIDLVWSTGDIGKSAIISEPQVVTILAENEFTCTKTFEQKIHLECLPEVYVPTAFTPNEDQINDVLEVKHHNIETLQLWLYNKYGEVIFNTTQKNPTWSGKGHPNGLYYFRIEYTGKKDGRVFLGEQNGTVQLIR